MNKNILLFVLVVIIITSSIVFSQRTSRGSREGGMSSRGRNVGRIEKDPNSIEEKKPEKKPEKEQTLEQRFEILEKEIRRLESRIRLLELDNEALFYELISFRAMVDRENIIDDIRKNRDTRTQEERWDDMGYYPIIVGE